MIPEQTEAETILTMLGVLSCVAGWLLVYMGTRLAGICAGLAGGMTAAQILVGLIGVSVEQSGWWVVAGGVIGGLGGLFLTGMAVRLAFGLAGLALGALIGDGLSTGWLNSSSLRTPPVVSSASSPGPGFIPVLASGDRLQVMGGGQAAAPAPTSRVAAGWSQQRIQAILAGAFLGAIIGVVAQKLFIIGLTAYLGVALLYASFPPLRDHPNYIPWVLAGSVIIQSGLAWKFLKKATKAD